MANWLELSQKINEKPLFATLTRHQLEAVIDILCLMMYADNRVSTLEEIEFRETLLRLPWLENQAPLVDGRVNVAASKARYAVTSEDRQVLADSAGHHLSEEHTAETVFELAVTMAHSDLVFHEREKDVLHVLAGALGIAPGRAEELAGRSPA